METALEVTDKQLVHLIATNPTQMEAAQRDLAKFLRAKVAEVKNEIADVTHAHAVAVENKWSSSVLKRQIERAQDNLLFYEKTLAAVDAGYCIIPNFPIDVFAIRTDRNQPRRVTAESEWGARHANRGIPDEKGRGLPAGEGRYVSQNQIVDHDTQVTKDDKTGKEKTKHLAWPVAFAKIVFPINAARPEVMDATSQALVLKVFDEIGICPQTAQADPLIIGRIVTKARKWGQPEKSISFLIAWHLDLRTL